MNKIKNQLVLIIAFSLITCANLQGQTLKAWMNAADTSFQQKDYYSAFRFYDAALQYDSTLIKALYRKGRAAYAFNDYDAALETLDKLLDYDTTNTYSDATFWMGKVYQTMGQFNKAIEYFNGFISNPGKSPSTTLVLARKGISDSRWASAATLREQGIRNPENLGGQINSPDSDFGAIFKDGTIYYSSFQFPFENDERRPARNLIQLMQVDPGSAEGIMIQIPLNSTENHTAYTTFSLDEKRVYFCLCEYVNTADIRCDIYQSQQDTSGLWQAATPLSINLPEKTTTQPAIGRDPQTGKEVLYFASDRDQGQGQMDIWYGKVGANGDVKEAINLTDLNTPYNDATPFFHELSRQLYFASDGHQTFGGYDINSSYFSSGKWQDPVNLGLGVNSSFNESHFALDENGDYALLDSDRPGSIYLDSEAEVCCYDIYKVDLDNKIDLEVYTFNAMDSTPLFDVNVSLNRLNLDQLLVDKETDYSNFDNIRSRFTQRDSQRSAETNRYEFKLNRQYMYSVLGEKLAFLRDSQLVNLIGLDREVKKVRKDLYLMPEEINLRVITVDEADGSDLFGCTVDIVQILAPYDSLLLARETKDLANIFERRVSSNYNYYLKASRPGYETRDYLLEITPELLAEVGRNITVTIPLPRYNFQDLLPLALYFDNAIPYNRNYSPTTEDNFEDLSKAYVQKEAEFFQQFSSLLDEDEKFEVERYYQDFFTREVQGGLDNLNGFNESLKLYLGKGNKLTIQVRGYASPIAGSRYNEMLSLRRIKSLENFFREYDNGVFETYINNGQLEIAEAAFGEKRVGLDIPEKIKSFLANLGDLGKLSISNSKDRRLTVYSLLACIERRVEIVEVKTETNNK